MSKRAEELAATFYPEPKLEDYDDILVYRADRDSASIGRILVKKAYEQAEKDIAEIVKQFVEQGDRCMDSAADGEDQGAYTFWDGFHNCAQNILRALNNE